MTLPAGITTCTVTIGKALGSLGEDASLSGTLTLDRRLVWSATGDTLYGVPSTVTPSQSGGWLSFIVAHVDQAGFVDQSGNSITGFSYTFSGRATFADGSVEPIVKHFQVFVGQSTLDLDLLPDGPATLPVVTPTPPVDNAAVAGFVTNAGATKDALSVAISDVLVGSIYPSTVLADQPLSYWRLGEASGTTAADETDAHPGAYVGGVTLGTIGLVAGSNKAITLDGANDRVVVKADGAILSGLAAWTIEAVIAPTAPGLIYAERGSTGNDILFVGIAGNGRMFITYRDHAGVLNEFGAESTNVLVGGAHHVVFTKDGATVRMYDNGVTVGTFTLTASDTFGEVTCRSWIGADPNGEQWLGGVIDEVAIYATALTSGRVGAHAAAVAGQADTDSQSDGAPQVNPVLSITTAGGAQILSKEDYVNATMALTGVPGQADIFDTLRIRGRGNLTWQLPKKPFKLKLDNSQPLLGLPTSKDWALLASYTDKAAMNTPLADQLGYLAPGLAWSPHYGFVDVFLNNVYQGNYQVIESVVLAASRVNATKATGTTGLALTGAYLMEINNGGQDPEDPSFTTTRGIRVLFDDPDGTTAEQAAYMSTWFQSAEDALYGSGYADPSTGYRVWLDTPSFIDWYLIEELAGNAQGSWQTSAKCYKKRDTADTLGKLYMGPLWDFDESFGTSNAGDQSATGFRARPSGGWIDRMMSDATFLAETRTRWAALKAAITAAGGINKMIDRAIARTASPQIRDGRKWGYDPDWSAMSAYKKTWVSARFAWMDENYGIAPLGAYPTAVLADTPLSYYRLGELSGTTAVDEVAANPGTYGGGFTLGATGLLAGDTNKAVTLDGSTGHVLVKTGGAVLSGRANWSVEAVIKPTGQSIIYAERGPEGNDILNLLAGGNGRYGITVRDHAGVLDQFGTSDGHALNGNKHHVVFSKAGASLKVYEDGVLLDTFTLTASDTFGEPTTVCWIGGEAQDTTSRFAGVIDEVALYGTALSQSRVTAHNTVK